MSASPLNDDYQPSVVSSPTIFTGTGYSFVRMTVALFLWLVAIHFVIVLVLTALLFLPTPVAIMVFGVLLLFMVIPLNDRSKLGRKLARFICKYACGYFPITLHVEDIKAFDPNKAYVFGYEPHSVLPIAVCILADLTGFMPLPKIKVLASSAALLYAVLEANLDMVWIGFGIKEEFLLLFGKGIQMYNCAWWCSGNSTYGS